MSLAAQVDVFKALLLGGAAMAMLPTMAVAQTTDSEDSGEIVVTATRTEQRLEDVPVAITVQDIDLLRRDGFTYGTDEFRGIPGVSFRRGEGDGDEFPFVSIRGSTGTEGFLTLVDGVPHIGIYEEAQLNEIPYGALDRIEVVRGPVSALYGRGALYGAVNYITRSPREDATSVRLTAGSDDYYRGEALVSRKLGDAAGVLLGASYENYDGWRESGGREILSIFAKADVDLGTRTKLTGFINYSDRHSELPNGLPLDRNGNVIEVAGDRRAFLGYGDPVNDQQGGIGWLKLEHQASDALTFTATGQYRRFDRDVFLNFYDPFGFDPSRNVYAINGFRGDTRHKVLFGEATANWRPAGHNILFGVSGERATVREDIRWTGQFGFTPQCGFAFFLIEIDYTTGQVVNGDNPCFVQDLPYTQDRFVNSFWGAFVQDEWQMSERLFLTVGARYDSFRRKAVFEALPASGPGGTLRGKAHAFSPKAALSWRPDWGQVYASYGRGFNSNFGPTFEWDAAQYARPESRPTTIDSYELGVKGHTADRRLTVEAAIYYTRQKNRRQIIPNPDAETDPTAPSNLISYGDLYDSKGVEVSATLRPADGTSVRINYSHIDPKWKKYVINTGFGPPVDLSGTTPVGVARNIVYIAAEQRIASWLSGRATFEWYDDYKITGNNRVEGGGYELLTLGARIAPTAWRNISLDLTLTNALDKEYYFYFGGRSNPTYATPGVPRQFRAALRVAF